MLVVPLVDKKVDTPSTREKLALVLFSSKSSVLAVEVEAKLRRGSLTSDWRLSSMGLDCDPTIIVIFTLLCSVQHPSCF